MKGFWTADSTVENIIYILLALAWVVIQLVARNAKRKMEEPPAGPTRSPPRPPPSVLDPEEELRRFLRELSGETTTSPAPPPISTAPAPAPPPAFAPPSPPPLMPSKAGRAHAEKVRRKPKSPSAAAFPPPHSAVVGTDRWEAPSVPPAAAYTEPARAAVPLTPRSSLSFSVPLPSPRSVGAFSTTFGPRSRRRLGDLRLRDRRTLRKAVLYQAILGPPRAFTL